LTAEAGWTGPAITLELPAAQLGRALDLLRLALAEPAFQPAQVIGQIQRAAASLAQAAASPQARVQQELPAAIYPDSCRAARPVRGTPATVARLTPHDIADFHWDQVRPADTTIVIAGDLDGPDAAALASQAFTTWQDDRPAARWILPLEPLRRSSSRPLARRRSPGSPLVNLGNNADGTPLGRALGRRVGVRGVTRRLACPCVGLEVKPADAVRSRCCSYSASVSGLLRRGQ